MEKNVVLNDSEEFLALKDSIYDSTSNFQNFNKNDFKDLLKKCEKLNDLHMNLVVAKNIFAVFLINQNIEKKFKRKVIKKTADYIKKILRLDLVKGNIKEQVFLNSLICSLAAASSSNNFYADEVFQLETISLEKTLSNNSHSVNICSTADLFLNICNVLRKRKEITNDKSAQIIRKFFSFARSNNYNHDNESLMTDELLSSIPRRFGDEIFRRAAGEDYDFIVNGATARLEARRAMVEAEMARNRENIINSLQQDGHFFTKANIYDVNRPLYNLIANYLSVAQEEGFAPLLTYADSVDKVYIELKAAKENNKEGFIIKALEDKLEKNKDLFVKMLLSYDELKRKYLFDCFNLVKFFHKVDEKVIYLEDEVANKVGISKEYIMDCLKNKELTYKKVNNQDFTNFSQKFANVGNNIKSKIESIKKQNKYVFDSKEAHIL